MSTRKKETPAEKAARIAEEIEICYRQLVAQKALAQPLVTTTRSRHGRPRPADTTRRPIGNDFDRRVRRATRRAVRQLRCNVVSGLAWA